MIISIRLSLGIFLTLFLMSSCGKLTPVTLSSDVGGISTLNRSYVEDSDAGGLFEKNQWYTYYFAQHSVLTSLDVYALRAKGRFYKMQIIEFYKNNDNTQLGYYTLRLDDGSGMKLVNVNAHACGHAQSNPSYNDCLNSEKNRYAYLNLETLEVRYLSDGEAKLDREWDIAFKADFIKLNSGESGPSSVRGAVLSRNLDYLTGDDQSRFEKLFTALNGDRDLARFNQNYDVRNAFFYGPDGVKRVVYEKFWYQENEEGLRSAIASNWWIIKNDNNTSYSKLNIASIEEVKNGEDINTVITLNVHTQESGERFFPLLREELTINVNSNDRKRLCIDLNGRPRLVECSRTQGWDLRFAAKKRQWVIQTRRGAQGPFPVNEIIDITAGN